MFTQATPEQTKTFHQIYKSNIDKLIELFPKTFNKEFPLPLALGSHKVIQKATGWKPWKVHAVMAIWTARMEYVMMCCSEQHRYDVEGNCVHMIQEDHIKNFVIRLGCFRNKQRIAEFVKAFYVKYNWPALMNVPVNSRPDLSRWL